MKLEASSASDRKHSPGGRFPLFSKDGQMLYSPDVHRKIFTMLDHFQKNVLSLGPKGFVVSLSGLQLQQGFLHQRL